MPSSNPSLIFKTNSSQSNLYRPGNPVSKEIHFKKAISMSGCYYWQEYSRSALATSQVDGWPGLQATIKKKQPQTKRYQRRINFNKKILKDLYIYKVKVTSLLTVSCWSPSTTYLVTIGEFYVSYFISADSKLSIN